MYRLFMGQYTEIFFPPSPKMDNYGLSRFEIEGTV